MQKLRACWEPCTEPVKLKNGKFFFDVFSEFFFPMPNGFSGSCEERKHSYSHVTLEEDASLQSMSAGLLSRAARAQNRRRQKAALSSSSHFVFSWHHLQRKKSFLSPVLFFFTHFDSQTVFYSCLAFHGCMVCDYSDLKLFIGPLGCRAHVITYMYVNDLSSQIPLVLLPGSVNK